MGKLSLSFLTHVYDELCSPHILLLYAKFLYIIHILLVSKWNGLRLFHRATHLMHNVERHKHCHMRECLCGYLLFRATSRQQIFKRCEKTVRGKNTEDNKDLSNYLVDEVATILD